MTTRRKLYISSYGPEERPVKIGFFWLLDTAVREGRERAYLAVPTLQNLDGVIATSLDKDLVKRLKRDKSIPISYEGASLTLGLLTDRIDSHSLHQGPALVFYPNARLLEKIDDCYEVTHVLVVPWLMKDIEEWIQTWNAKELGKVDSQPSEPVFSDPVVEQALKSLTRQVNLSTGLGHPSDRDSAIWLFRKLKRANIRYSPIEIKGWLVRHGWRTEYANDVKEVAEKIQNGKRLRTRSRGEKWVKHIVKIWREEASKR
ncbi:MAG: hypothetical protein OXG78_09245 [Chloroflexi bacterium]|nr:hypothetical protein [Chloroflexota bacterium]